MLGDCLLSEGAEVNVKNIDGKTSLEEDIVSLFIIQSEVG